MHLFIPHPKKTPTQTKTATRTVTRNWTKLPNNAPSPPQKNNPKPNPPKNAAQNEVTINWTRCVLPRLQNTGPGTWNIVVVVTLWLQSLRTSLVIFYSYYTVAWMRFNSRKIYILYHTIQWARWSYLAFHLGKLCNIRTPSPSAQDWAASHPNSLALSSLTSYLPLKCLHSCWAAAFLCFQFVTPTNLSWSTSVWRLMVLPKCFWSVIKRAVFALTLCVKFYASAH